MLAYMLALAILQTYVRKFYGTFAQHFSSLKFVVFFRLFPLAKEPSLYFTIFENLLKVKENKTTLPRNRANRPFVPSYG